MRSALFCLLLAACYSPAERDCTVSCTAANDCVGGQVCGADHFCAAPSVAGHCSAVDAAPASHDARSADAPGDVRVMLTVAVMGNGRVDVQGLGACAMMCDYQVVAGQTIQLTASQTKPNKSFAMWMDACSGSQPTCALTPVTDARVTANFE